MKVFWQSFVALSAVLLYSSIYANDTAGTTAGGGITFSKSPDIVLEREELTISPNDVAVSYLFDNKSNQDIQTQVFFPLPAYKMQGANATWDNEINPNVKTENSPFLNFSVTIQGQPVRFNVAQQATMNGQDVTQQLQAAHIPLNPDFTAGRIPLDPTTSAKVPQWQNQARQLGLLDDKNNPKWNKQIIYYWTQIFPAHQQLLVEHHYRPATGMMYAAMEPATTDPKELLDQTISRLKQTFGINIENFQNNKILSGWLTQQIKNNATNTSGIFAYFYNVNYILKTGANWAGPIKNFTLNIIKPQNSIVTYNPFFQKRDVKTEDLSDRKVIFIKNFVPQQNLQVLYATSSQLNLQNTTGT